MREPKTPLPWAPPTHRAIPSPVQKTAVLRADGLGIGFFAETDDRDYAVHAANVLPEVLAALETAFRALVALTGETEEQDRYRRFAIDKIEAALAKAEGADETPRER
jgi:hypothetical protein